MADFRKGGAGALQWLFFLSQHIMPAAGKMALRIRAKVAGVAVDESIVAQGEQALSVALPMVESHLARSKWMLGDECSLVDCTYCPVLNVVEKADLSFDALPKTKVYLDACRDRPAWAQTPKVPGL